MNRIGADESCIDILTLCMMNIYIYKYKICGLAIIARRKITDFSRKIQIKMRCEFVNEVNWELVSVGIRHERDESVAQN